jgi:hypothetical protein
MSNTIPQQLLESRYIDTAEPVWMAELLETGTAYDFEYFSAFDAAQRTCGGSKLGITFQACLEFMTTRHDDLERCDAESSSFPWCSAGIWAQEDGLNWVSWYETTSGTHFIIGELGGSLCLSAHLPEDRGDNHRQKLIAAQKGRTLEQYHRWYNAYLLDSEERETAYAEESKWWNEHMADAFEPMATLEQLKLSRKVDRVIGSFYGEWASAYGPVGDAIKTALGSSDTATTGMRPQEISPEKVDEMWDTIEHYLLQCHKRLKEARSHG